MGGLKKSSLRSTVVALGLLALGLTILGPLYIEYLFNNMAFLPLPGIDVHPDRFRVPIEEVYITTEDGVKVHGFYFSRANSDRVMLFFHGNYGNASQRLGTAKEIYDLDTNVLLMDYRGYGRSEGKPSESGIYLDGKAAAEFLINEKGFSESRIVLYGRSIGAAVAVDLAQDRDFAGLVLLSPMSSAPDVAVDMGLGWLAPFVKGRLDLVTKIRNVRIPVVFFHGEHDEMIPWSMGQAVFENASHPKTFYTVERAGHNDLIQVARGWYWETLKEILDFMAPPSAVESSGKN